MSRPLITVLMTVYNGGVYLLPAVGSVLRQTYKDFEFLIINDCSTDGSVEIIRSFADDRIRLVNNEKNSGQTCSLNKGLSLARGRYIARIDADDLVFPQWLEKNFALIEAQPQTVVVSCKAVVIDSSTKPQKVLNTPMSYPEMVLRSLTASPINHVGSLFKTDVITSVGGYDENLKVVADYGLWSTLIRKGMRLASHPEILVAVRVHEKSVSVTERGRKDVGEMCRVMAENFKTLTALSLNEENILSIWRLCYSPEMMSDQDFQQALALFTNAYKNIKPEFKIEGTIVEAYVRDRLAAFYAKRALGEMAGGRGDALRTLSSSYNRSYGMLNIFSLLWLGSWLGGPVLKRLPGIYEQWKARTAKEELRKGMSEELVFEESR